MKKETKEVFALFHPLMSNLGLEDYSIEILLQNKKEGIFIVYTISCDTNNYDERALYLGGFDDENNINEENPCVWLASLLELDYEIIFCSLTFHCMIWDMFYDCYDDIENYENGLYEYLRYCKQHQISNDLLEAYSGREFDDVADLEFYEIVNGYSIVNRFTIDEHAFLFGINETIGTYGVYDSDSDYTGYENEKIYQSYLEAFNDFQERIKKYWYDKLRIFNEEYFFCCGGDEELNKIMNGKKKLS